MRWEGICIDTGVQRRGALQAVMQPVQRRWKLVGSYSVAAATATATVAAAAAAGQLLPGRSRLTNGADDDVGEGQASGAALVAGGQTTDAIPIAAAFVLRTSNRPHS
jgi:hypothetical protein